MGIYSKFSFILCVVLSLAACKKEPSVEAIRIGEVETLTGPEASIGESIHRGVSLAVQEINAHGGIAGHPLELITLDDQGRSEEATTAVSKLIHKNKVHAIIGSSASSRSLAMAAIAQNQQIPMITPTSTHPKITQTGDFIFRVCFMDSFQGRVIAEFALQKLKARKVAILRDIKSDYSLGLAEFFLQTFQEGKGSIVVEQSYSSGDADFKSQLTSIRGKSPDAIFIPGYYADAALIARQARELGIQVPILGGDGWSSPQLLEIGGEAMNKSYFADHFSNEDPAPQIQNFVKEFQKSFHVIPNGLAALGYDSLAVLADAFQRAKTTQSRPVRLALANTVLYQGITGRITIDQERNARKAAYILGVEHGKVKVVEKVE